VFGEWNDLSMASSPGSTISSLSSLGYSPERALVIRSLHLQRFWSKMDCYEQKEINQCEAVSNSHTVPMEVYFETKEVDDAITVKRQRRERRQHGNHCEFSPGPKREICANTPMSMDICDVSVDFLEREMKRMRLR